MGTPLSFVVLSWVNAFATNAFTAARIHGDDAVGLAMDFNESIDYSDVIADLGASLNLTKTFVTPSNWTMCEILGLARQGNGRTGTLFVAPPCPAPGLRAPVPAESRCSDLFLRRQERVMKALFPYVVKDPRLHLPTSVGGLGYTGRGLNVSRSVRQHLGSLVSRGPNITIAKGMTAKRTFREEGLFPRPIISVPKQPWKVKRELDSLMSDDGVEVSMEALTIFENRLVESTYRLTCGDDFRRKRDSGRPERAKGKALFKRLKGKYTRPLGRGKRGILSLEKFALKVKAFKVKVFPDVALEIRDSISIPQYA